MTADIIKLFEMVLLLGAGALSSCSKSDGGDAPGTGTERPCIFSAVTEGTKTSYSGVMSGSSERINWAVGDTVHIYSPQAYLTGEEGPIHFCDYRITQVSTPAGDATSSSGTLASLSGSGLVWADDTSDHYFYSVYPSPSTHGMSSNVEITAGSDNGVVISATIPATQTASSWSGSETGTLTGAPDMRYAYMVASSMVNPSAASIPMSYEPWFTAFQIEIGTGAFGANDGSVTIDSFTLSTSGSDDALAGKFTLTGTAGGTISAEKGQSTSDSVTMTVNKTIKGENGKLVLTVFTLPIDHTQITLTFTGPEIGTRSLDLKRSGTWLEFDPCKKIKITGLSLPENKFDTGGEDISWGAPPFGGPFILDGTTYYLSNGDLYLKTAGADFASSTFGLKTDPFYSVESGYNVPSSSLSTNNTTVNRSYFNWLELGSLFSEDAVSESNTTNIDNTTVPAGIDSGCKVPTWAQWEALTTTAGRTGSTVTISGTEHSSCRFTKVAVSGKSYPDALVLFPDGVSITISESLTFNTSSSSFTSISESTYSTLLAAGCVFLPAAGYSNGGGGWDYRGSYGYYWSSTAYVSRNAYNLFFDSSRVNPASNRKGGNFFPVRLLR